MASLKKLDAEEAELAHGQRPSNALELAESQSEASAKSSKSLNSEYEPPVVEAEKLIGDTFVIMTHNEKLKSSPTNKKLTSKTIKFWLKF